MNSALRLTGWPGISRASSPSQPPAPSEVQVSVNRMSDSEGITEASSAGNSRRTRRFMVKVSFLAAFFTVTLADSSPKALERASSQAGSVRRANTSSTLALSFRCMRSLLLDGGPRA